MQTSQNVVLFLTLIGTLLISTLNHFAYAQETPANGQQTAATSEQAPGTVNYYYGISPPPNPTAQQPPPVFPQGASNASNQQSQNPQITDPLVLATAFAGAAAGVIYRTIYPYFERLHEMEVRGEEPVKFLTKYKFTFGISLLISLVTTIGLFSGLLPQLDVGAGLGMIFISSFVQGIGWNELTNRVSYKIGGREMEKEAATKEQPSLKSTAKEIIGLKDETKAKEETKSGSTGIDVPPSAKEETKSGSTGIDVPPSA